jgi:hypothetical protein
MMIWSTKYKIIFKFQIELSVVQEVIQRFV